MENKKTQGFNWSIILLIIFYPVGLIVLIRKLMTNKLALINGKTGALSTIGWIFTIIGAIEFIFIRFNILETPNDAKIILSIIFFIMFVGGILILRKVSKYKKIAIRYKEYKEIIFNQNIRDISYIAKAVDMPYDFVEKDLQNMIEVDYLENAYINHGKQTIVVKLPASDINKEVYDQQIMQNKVVRCSGCGANNTVIENNVSECEYCGTAISG